MYTPRYGHSAYAMPRVFADIQATNIKSCPHCGEKVSMQHSRQTNREYPTDVRVTADGFVVTKRNEFHKCRRRRLALRPTTTLDAKGIYELFEKAKAAGLKHPKIRLLLPSVAAKMHTGDFIDPKDEVVLHVAGERSKYKDNILVTDGRDYPNNTLYGTITRDGVLGYRPVATPEVLGLLTDLSKDPASVAAKYGQLTGNCCFCNRSLDDERSTKMGYGPVCALKFGLPWGGRP